MPQVLAAAKNALRAGRDHLLYKAKRAAIERDWKARFRRIYSLHPEYRTPAQPELERQHAAYWKRFGKVRLDTLRVCYNIAHKGDYRIVPEEIQASTLERCLNAGIFPQLLGHKGFYERLYGSIFPHVFFQCLEGLVVGSDLRPIDASALAALLKRLPYPVVFKPSIDSSGGRGLVFPRDAEELSALLGTQPNFVVQETLLQHPFFSDYNPSCLNTLRVYVYRSVRDESYHVLNVTARFGRGGSLDNETAGGIVASVDSEGRFRGYALDKYGEKFIAHPDSGLPFEQSRQIPKYADLIECATHLAASIPLLRLIGFDFCLQQDLNWRCIEINSVSSTIRFAQYHGEPFFGPFTDEVIEYCLRHPHFDRVTSMAY
jgi:hypothetical protein